MNVGVTLASLKPAFEGSVNEFDRLTESIPELTTVEFEFKQHPCLVSILITVQRT